ncbi:MAG: cytochrome c biogenesis protein CcsA [Gemmataceae bacterium]|nr:cytochrome c biogenesis protein CcsA [Gemmataceae bacterium]
MKKNIKVDMQGDLSRFIPWLVAGAAAVCLIVIAIPPADREGEMRLHAFARLPVVDRGRVKPIDTMARTTLMTISGRQTARDDGGKYYSATEWLLRVMTQRADDLKVFRIENDQLLNLLGLEVRPGSWRYAYSEFEDKMPILMREAVRAHNKEASKQDLFDTKVLQLQNKIDLYFAIGKGVSPYVLPPAQKGSEWQALRGSGEDNTTALAFVNILTAYAGGNAPRFNRAVADYEGILEKAVPAEFGRTGFETFFNHFAPFYACSVVYVLVFMLACLSWAVPPDTVRRSAFWLAVVAVLVHTWALLARMYLMDRPFVFVTNLYSSAIFIGWMCVVLGLVLEWIYRNGIGAAVAGATGSMSLFVAHYLGSDGDTLEMLQAVLDTNFWLATHVTSITIGYASTFIAGFLGIFFIIMGVFTTHLKGTLLKTLTQMIYGIVCFSMFFSFVGTVLGGIWADQSWGRFWGWDPKENGALLLVLWNALILHARWSGMIKQRGLAVLAVGGNMVTGWSWFGTNQLGVGLHAYGFNNTLAMALTIFWVTQLIAIGIGLTPLNRWKSFAPAQPQAGDTNGTPTAPAAAAPPAREQRKVAPTAITK